MAEKHPLHRVWASGPFDLDGLSEAAERLIPVLTEVLRPVEGGAIPAGVVALQGEMGAGKTTLVKALCAAWNVVVF